jgi:hypothetical protein
LAFLLYGSGAGACVGWLGSWFREGDGAFFGGEIHWKCWYWGFKLGEWFRVLMLGVLLKDSEMVRSGVRDEDDIFI